jgi:hypothetical protein
MFAERVAPAKNRRGAEFSSLSTVNRRSRMAVLRRLRIRNAPARPLISSRECARWRQNERPVRGDNRTGQAIRALGVDGRSRRIQPRWGGMTAPTHISRGWVAGRSKRAAIFLTFFAGYFRANYRAAGRFASWTADLSDAMLSDAMAAAGGSKSLVRGTS